MDYSDFQVLQSSVDPSYLVITDRANFDRAVQGHLENEPGDHLITLTPDLAAFALRQAPDMDVLKSFIGMMGFYGHSTC